MKKAIAVFPGQGAQKVGMGQDFYDNAPVAKEMFEQASQALGFDISKICFEGPEEELKLTANVQPAILTVSCIAFELAKTKFAEDYEFVAYAGHSLGEYSAAVAAGVIDFAEAARLVNKRGEFMQEAVPSGSGAMLAVLGKEVEEIETALEGYTDLSIANINAPGQVVISGAKPAAEKFQSENSSWKLIELAVSAPFHCPLMQPAQDKLSTELDQLTFNDATPAIITNVNATPETTGTELKELLKQQVTARVRWVESMEYAIKELGIETIIEFGPGNVLTGLMKRIDRNIEKINVQSFSDI